MAFWSHPINLNEPSWDTWSPPPKKTAPSSNPRYYKSTKTARRHYNFTSEQCPKDSVATGAWVCYIHPEGLPYWHDPSRNITTNANLQDVDVARQIKEVINSLYVPKATSSVLVDKYETVLELDSAGEEWGYYLIDHERQVVFYYDTVCTEDLGFPEFCSIDHLNLELHRQYWVFVEYFPAHFVIPASSEAKLLGLLIHSWGDRTTSDLSTSPYSVEDCRKLIDIVQQLTDEPEQRSCKNAIIGRFMENFYQARVINLYGEPGARLARNQSILRDVEERSDLLLFPLISMAMFIQPKRELEALNQLSVDAVPSTELWREYIATRTEEWNGVSLMSGIVLTVNTILVSHLATQPVPANLLNEVSAKLAFYGGIASMLLSISTITMGATATAVYRPHLKSQACDAGAYLSNASHTKYGLQPLAIVLSLPRTLFSWGLITSLVSLVAFGAQTMDKWGMIVFQVYAVPLALPILWGVWSLRSGSHWEGIADVKLDKSTPLGTPKN